MTRFAARALPALSAVMLAACLTAVPGPARAQTTLDDRPYDDQLLRLSEILGAIHYLRELCGADEGQTWRDQMQRLITSEGTTAIRRAKLVKGFNRGYRGYRRTYRSCTEPARTAVERFMEEGAQLASSLLDQNR